VHTSCRVQAAAKRYKITGSGKVMVRRAGKQHLNEKQSSKTKRNLGCVA
jgi:large subunit ribosomal protein L35